MTHPLKVLGMRQRQALLADVHRTERAIREAYLPAQEQARAAAEQFAHAYQLEYDRLNADRDPDDPPKRVPLVWLRASGQGGRLVRAFADAAGQAAEESRRVVSAAIQQAALRGQADARAQLVRAMRPAVKAGMDWTPKEPKPPRPVRRSA